MRHPMIAGEVISCAECDIGDWRRRGAIPRGSFPPEGSPKEETPLHRLPLLEKRVFRGDLSYRFKDGQDIASHFGADKPVICCERG